VQRGVVVDAALVHVGATLQQQLDDLPHVGARSQARLRLRARHRGDQRWEAVIGRPVGVGTTIEQLGDHRDRAVVDRVGQAGADPGRRDHVGEALFVDEFGADRLEVAGSERSVESERSLAS
jgi:hypothetical protein